MLELTLSREILNARTSPLLRLPAELRNRVYDYVFGNIVITTGTATIHRRPLRRTQINFRRPSVRRTYDYLSAREQGSYKDLKYLCGLMFVCRKLYMETQLLPFASSTFYIGIYCISRLQLKLAIKHRNVVSHISIDYSAIRPQYCTSKAIFEYCDLVSLVGLKRITVLGCPDYCRLNKAGEDKIVANLRQHTGRDDIVVEFERVAPLEHALMVKWYST
tara:strand:- start:14935 stop:15591 length:657 start_codon:yes stop_codon:yes gene_type:complete